MSDKLAGRVMLSRTIRGDWPFGHTTVAPAGVYDAYCNPQGAVSVRAENGELLGLKPGEFEWLSRA